MLLTGLSVFFEDRKQRVVVNGIVKEHLNINSAVPKGTVLEPIFFSIMLNDIKWVHPMNQLVTFADDMTLGIPGKEDGDTYCVEVDNINVW